MINKVKIFICLIFGSSFYGHSQEGPQIIPPAPNAAKISQFIETPTSLYTGSQNFSVPLHTIQFEGVSIPISINYHSGGIRANEDASMVGLGWAFNAAGSISRTVKGYNDFLPTGYVNDTKAIPTSPITDIVEGVWTVLDQPYYDHLTGTDNIDTEPDIFTYNLLGSSGMFVLSKKSLHTDPVNVIKLKENADSVQFDETGKFFTVTLSNGFKGVFDIHEYTLGIGGSSSNLGKGDGCDVNHVDISQAISDGKRAITTWHLSQIVSAKGRVLNFEYLHQPGTNSNYISVSADRFGDYQSYYSNLSIYGSGATETCSKNIFEHVYLSKISNSSSGDRVEFSYDSRLDVETLTTAGWLDAIEGKRGSGNIVSSGAQRLTGINIFNDLAGSTLNKSVILEQTYFNDSYISDPEGYKYLRLRLDRVSIDDQNYDFEYLNGQGGLPDKSTKGIDYWGFYNGQPNTHLYPEIGWLQPVVLGLNFDQPKWTTNQYNYFQADSRKADFEYGKAGLMNKITYPTGGSTKYDYESHEYKLEGDEYIENFSGGSAFASGLTGTATDEFDFIGSQNIQRPNGQIEVFQKGCPTNVLVTFRVMCKNYWNMGSTPCDIADADRTVVAVELWDETGTRLRSFAYDQLWGPGFNLFEKSIIFELEAGTYTINAFNIVDGNGETKYYGEAKVTYAPQCDAASTAVTNPVQFNQVAGGARIAVITSYDQADNAVLKRSYEYVQDPPVFSSGKLMNPLLYVYQECNPVRGNEVCIFLAISGDAMAGSGAAQGSHIGYSHVKETFEDPNSTTNNGHKLYYYINESNVFESYGVAPAISHNRENGIIESEYVTGKTTRQIKYNDNFELVGTPVSALAQRGTGVNQIGILHYYDLETMFITPKEIIETTTYPSGAFVTRTNRSYNNYYQLSSEITTDSEGKVAETVLKYPYDLLTPAGGVYAKMIDKRLLTAVEKISKVDGQVVNATGTKYKFEGSMVLPDEVFVFNPDLGQFSSTSDGLNFGGGYESGLNYKHYNNAGKIEEYVGRDGIHIVFIWGYNLNYPVAKISNATKGDITGLGVLLDTGPGGLSTIDENTLRTGLPQALITTYSYDPGRGIISQSDPNNITTYYEYDEYGRLKLVKDHEGNVLSRNEYNYINK